MDKFKGLNWKPIASAPKDGRQLLLTWMDDGTPQEVYLMQWGHIQRNPLVGDKIGMWVALDGSFTWNDVDGNGPTHWVDYQEYLKYIEEIKYGN